MLLKSATPVYPEDVPPGGNALIVLSYLVNQNGQVKDIKVLRGIPEFSQAAIDALSKFVYKPASHGGEPVAVVLSSAIRVKESSGLEEE